MGRHYVFMLILSGILHIWASYHEYIKNPCLSVCVSPDKTNLKKKITDRFLINIHIWIRQVMEHILILCAHTYGAHTYIINVIIRESYEFKN